MRWASPSTTAVLPTPGSPMSTGLFFVRRDRTWMTRRISSSRPMTGSSLPFWASCRQVAAVAFERLVLVLGILIRHALAASHLGERRQDAIGRQPVRLQQPRGRGAPGLAGDGEEQVLGADVLVLQPAGLGLRQVGDQLETRRDGGLRSAVDLRLLADGRTRLARDGGRVELQLPQQRRHDAVVLLDQRHQQVLGLDLRMIERLGELLRADDGLLGLFSELVEIH